MEMLRARYAWAASQAEGKDVLELACGAGLGLGVLEQAARSVTAGDLDAQNCAIVRETGFDVRQMDALAVPFRDQSFDIVILFEALYYLRDARAFFREARRLIRPGGRLLITAANPDWRGFNASPYHSHYYTAGELERALEAEHFAVRIHGAFPQREDAVTSWARGLARKFGWIPKTMRGKALLKRIFYGPLETIPPQVSRGASRLELIPVCDSRFLNCRVLYAEAIR
jgi:SAM-dependent methyltransferase